MIEPVSGRACGGWVERATTVPPGWVWTTEPGADRSAHAALTRGLPPELVAGPFTVGRARDLGVGDHLLRGRRFVAPFRGVRLPTALADDLEMRCRASALVLPAEAAFSHATALRLWRLRRAAARTCPPCPTSSRRRRTVPGSSRSSCASPR